MDRIKRNFQFLLAGLLLSSVSQHVLAGNWWDQNFQSNPPRWAEDNGSGSWGRFWHHGNNPHNPYHFGVVGAGHPVRAGGQSFRFEKRPGQCGGGDCAWNSERVELGADTGDQPGNDTWYAWSVYHQDYQFLDSVAPIHGQFKTANKGHQYAFFNMDQNRGMVINFDAFEGWSGTRVLIPKHQISNQWHDIRVHAKWSTGSDGVFQVWVNGVLKVDRRGQNAIDNDPIWFRFGIYAPQVNRAGNNYSQVVYYDELIRGNNCQSVSQFMPCPDGGSTGTESTSIAPGSTAGVFESYVNAYGDLNAAFNNGLQPGKSKAEFGQWHYCNYGVKEGRTSASISLAACNASLDTKTPDIDTNVDEMDNGLGGGRFTDEITTGIKRFSKVAVFNGDVFSFKDYYTFKAYEVNDTQGLMLGFSKRQESDGSTDDPVGIGWLFDNVALMVAQDNSMLGYDAQGIFDFIDPSTTYIDIGHRKKFADNITLFTDLIYAYGRSSDGDLVALSDIHALGFESKLEYVANDANIFVFKFDLPLHIEDGSSRFIVSQFGQPVPLNIGLVPDGREMRLSLGNDFRLFESSMITSRFMYTRDPDHRRGRSDYQFDIRYRFEY